MSRYDTSDLAGPGVKFKGRKIPSKRTQQLQMAMDKMPKLAIEGRKKKTGVAVPVVSKRKKGSVFTKLFGRNISNYLRDKEIQKALGR